MEVKICVISNQPTGQNVLLQLFSSTALVHKYKIADTSFCIIVIRISNLIISND